MEMLISKKELYQLRQDLRNKTKLHEAARARIENLARQNKELKERITALEMKYEESSKIIEELRRQLEELRAKIFKRRKKKNNDVPDEDAELQNDAGNHSREKKHATRPIPSAETVTDTRTHHLDTSHCDRCEGKLSAYQTVDYYIEDIVLPSDRQLKTVMETNIERGWCSACERWTYATAPPAAAVILGPKVKAYICYLSILLRLSYEQIRAHLSISYCIHVSDGEMSHILEKEAVLLRPEYEAINKRIDKQAGVHEDETSWQVQSGARGNYAWVKTGTETREAIFLFGESRGGAVAEKLTGVPLGVGITDDYVVYHRLFGDKHQLCFAHPFRKLRDLARSDVFDEQTRKHCREMYRRFSTIYTALRDTLSMEWNVERNAHIRVTLLRQLRTFAEPHAQDPLALKKIKARLSAVAEKYFTCLLYPGIPADNNKAERALRPLVIKRRTSFGSKTQKGAEVLSVLASIMLSLYWTKPDMFWQEYMALRVR